MHVVEQEFEERLCFLLVIVFPGITPRQSAWGQFSGSEDVGSFGAARSANSGTFLAHRKRVAAT